MPTQPRENMCSVTTNLWDANLTQFSSPFSRNKYIEQSYARTCPGRNWQQQPFIEMFACINFDLPGHTLKRLPKSHLNFVLGKATLHHRPTSTMSCHRDLHGGLVSQLHHLAWNFASCSQSPCSIPSCQVSSLKLSPGLIGVLSSNWLSAL